MTTINEVRAEKIFWWMWGENERPDMPPAETENVVTEVGLGMKEEPGHSFSLIQFKKYVSLRRNTMKEVGFPGFNLRKAIWPGVNLGIVVF